MLPPLRRAATALAVVGALLLGACGGSDDRPATGPRYVALGDSAVAGAGIGRTSPPCFNSDRGYAALVADRLGVEDFVDASCIGATTHDVLAAHTADTGEIVPPQIDDVTRDTDVVTISIGGNDGDYVPLLFSSCYSLQNSEKACRTAVDQPRATLDRTRQGIVRVLEAVRKKAPDALVIAVGYLPIMPDSGRCDPDVVRISPRDLSDAAAAERRVTETMRAAAQQVGVRYVDMRRLARGHDACAGDQDAWVSGHTAKPGDGTFLHPRAKGAAAVAATVAPLAEPGLTGSRTP
jgi:lysophospholipase L1-like esterase